MGRPVPPRPMHERIRPMNTDRLSADRRYAQALCEVYHRNNPYGIEHNPSTIYKLYKDLAENHYLRIAEKVDEVEPEGAIGFWIHPYPEDETLLCATMAILWLPASTRQSNQDVVLLQIAEQDLTAMGVDLMICPDLVGTPQFYLREGFTETERVYSKEL